MDDDELDQVMRAGLERRAERVDVAAPVADRAQRAARGRRTTRWAVAGLAAASVVVVAAVGLTLGGGDQSPVSKPSTSLRTEYWGSLQVQVPASWAFASIPGVCGEPPVGVPYVGRPIGYSYSCDIEDPDAVPTAPYVWLGAEVPVGTVDLGDGWTRETVKVDEAKLTVATKDEALRHQIIGSAASQEFCPAGLDESPGAQTGTTTEGYGAFIDARLCAYRREGRPQRYSLFYAKTVSEATVDDTVRSVNEAPEVTRTLLDCDDSEMVVVSGAYQDDSGAPDARLDRRVVYRFSQCGVRADGTRTDTGALVTIAKKVTEATVKPWATPEFDHLLMGPHDQWADRYFVDAQGH